MGRSPALLAIVRVSVFFLPEKRQSAREAVFWAYFDFFLGQKSAFSPTFSRFFGSFLAHFRNFSPTLFDFFLGLTINFLGHNSEIFLRQKYFFLGHFNLSQSSLCNKSPLHRAKTSRCILQKQARGEAICSEKNQGTPSSTDQNKKYPQGETIFFIEVCNENSHLGREPKYRKTKNPRGTVFCFLFLDGFFSVFRPFLWQKFTLQIFYKIGFSSRVIWILIWLNGNLDFEIFSTSYAYRCSSRGFQLKKSAM